MNTKSLLSVTSLVFGIAIAGCATTEKSLMEQGLKPLGDGEVKAMHSRTRTARWTNAQSTSGTVEYRADGTTSVNWGTGSAEGRYRIVANTFCTQYEGVRGGAENCVRIYKTGDNEYKSYRTNGDYNAVVSYTN